ncbi:hypothetical protein NM208_g2845 [Fusarium decemcellulare]|uniref:Uncharacterized protein n=1 Tax=Fusarium decemcellulare TaxID=57161 RepID=A0ACC1SRJ4_9HYPO|nr:hypothetical protein NM208_g2845 [Fusarium decemcellulare]
MSKEYKQNDDPETLRPVASRAGEVLEDTTTHDEVFGDITENSPNYRNIGWMGTVVLMMKTQIGLGVLSIPAVFDVLGIIPGVIILCIIGAITSWSDYIVGVFKLKHRHVYGIDDVGQMLLGRVGREILGTAFCLYFIFGAGSAMISVSIALNALSTHAVCTAVFVAVAAILGFLFASIRTLGRISWLAWVGTTCIIVAVITVTISVSQQSRPDAAPKGVPWKSDYKLVAHPSFTDAISACGALVFAYAGTPAFFNIVAEMRDPKEYTKALIVCQTLISIIYISIGIVVYYYCGSYVSSPALGSAGPLLKKICYGIALPGLCCSLILMLHLSSKFVFIRLLRGSKHLTSNSLIHWGTWLGSTFAAALIAYLIASGIPVFGTLISLIGALFGTLLSFQPMGGMWLYDNWKKGRQNPSLGWRIGVAWSIFVIVSGTFLMVAGTYSTIVGIIASAKDAGKPWACADNSGST